MKRVFVAEHPMEAQLLCGYLAGAGIDAEARGVHLFWLRGGLPLGDDTLPSIWVPDEQEGAALRFLAHAEQRERLQSVETGEVEGHREPGVVQGWRS